MTKYIKLFEEHNDYDDWRNSEEYVTPNVTMCKEENELHYNSIPHYAKIYYQGEVVGETEIDFKFEYGSSGYSNVESCWNGYYICLYAEHADAIEIDMYNGASNVNISGSSSASANAQFTYSMNGNTLRIEATSSWDNQQVGFIGCWFDFDITYTCNGKQCFTLIDINNCD